MVLCNEGWGELDLIIKKLVCYYTLAQELITFSSLCFNCAILTLNFHPNNNTFELPKLEFLQNEDSGKTDI